MPAAGRTGSAAIPPQRLPTFSPVHSSTSDTSVFILMPWLHVKYNYFEIIMKLFQCFISHVTIDGVTCEIKSEIISK